jgi:hypothetical protein
MQEAGQFYEASFHFYFLLFILLYICFEHCVADRGCPETHKPPAPAFQALGLQACTTMLIPLVTILKNTFHCHQTQ